jgi:hypothetical protein
MRTSEYCLHICPVQCWAAENLSVIGSQTTKVHDEKTLVEVDGELTAQEYLAKLDANAEQQADDPSNTVEAERLWLAEEYAVGERVRDEQLYILDRELNGRDEGAQTIRTTGSLALKTCSGVDPTSGLCTGEISAETDYLSDMYQLEA